MSVLTPWFQDFAARLCSPELLLDAHHTDHPTFFTHLRQQAQLVHEVSEQAFAQARAKLPSAVIPGLNDRLIARAKKNKFVPRWRGLRLVAADATTMRCRLRASQLVRNVSPSGEQRVLMTKLFDDKLYPADNFASLFHKRWGIEAAFKRLKHRHNLEHVTGLSRHAVAQDVAAKIICDNLRPSSLRPPMPMPICLPANASTTPMPSPRSSH